jgi:hypothetical protein
MHSKAFTDAAIEAVARAIADVKREAERAEALRAAEHRAFMAEQREALAEMRRAIEAKLATVKDGKDGERGEKGDQGEAGERGEQGPAGSDGVDGADGRDGADADMQALERRLEELVAAIPLPKDGQDGADGKDAYPGEARGLYDPEASYRALDVVSFNGSEWRAKRDEPGELPGDGWMLSAQRGKRGDKGDRGEKGMEGKAGKDGAQPIALKFDADKTEFVMILDSGEALEADLEPLMRAIGEAVTA